MTPKRIRADVAAQARGLAESRSKAQRIIMAGELWLDETRVAKPSTMIAAEDAARLEVRQRRQGYVGRGAEKLAPVLAASGCSVAGCRCLDVGASTGGFTEVLLEAGAREVWAIDVGYGQLHPRLRDDPRVVVRERSNFRAFDAEAEGVRFARAVVDLSFISARRILQPLKAALEPAGEVLLLVKPQFELGRGRVPSGGVVRDPSLVAEAVDCVALAAEEIGLAVAGRYPSPRLGQKGNQEVFLYLRASESR